MRYLSLFGLLFLGLFSCSKDTTTTTTECATVTYTNDIAAIFNASCATPGCHASTSPSDGIDLSSYDKSKNASLNGKVLASIKHSSGAKAMPQGSSKLSDATILKVECWISAGAPL